MTNGFTYKFRTDEIAKKYGVERQTIYNVRKKIRDKNKSEDFDDLDELHTLINYFKAKEL